MAATPNLALPLIAAGQAQKHVTHNEALLVIDALLQCAVLDRDLAAPPSSPAEGERYIVASAATGPWTGKSGFLAAWQGGVWRFYTPDAGTVAYVVDEARLTLFDGTAWVGATPSALQNLTRLGLGTAADAANPFSAKLNKALWTAKPSSEGGTGDLRYTLNKELATSVLSLLFQTGYSGRAELGLVGDDDVQLKMSADGSSWVDAVRVKTDGKVGIGTASPTEKLTVAGNIAPAVDNAYSIGTATRRPSTIYAATGVINTSDVRLKSDIRPLDPTLAAELLRAAPPIAFRWIAGGRDACGDMERAGRRRHFGWSAQAWDDALRRNGDDAGLLVRVEPSNPETELALRPDQIAAVQHAALLGLMDQVETLSARVAMLEVPG